MNTRKKYINYIDVLYAALALTKHRAESWDLPYDITAWCQAVDEICRRFQNEVPELQSISFDRRPGYPPFSREVEHWRHVMAQSGHFEWLMEGHARRIRNRRAVQLVLEKYPFLNPTLEEMARIFEKHLVVQKGS